MNHFDHGNMPKPQNKSLKATVEELSAVWGHVTLLALKQTIIITRTAAVIDRPIVDILCKSQHKSLVF